MKRFIEGADRGQSTLLPECLDDFIDEANPVRVIDAFVDALDLGELGFEGVEPEATGRPAYHPSVLLKLYIYAGSTLPPRRYCLLKPDSSVRNSSIGVIFRPQLGRPTWRERRELTLV